MQDRLKYLCAQFGYGWTKNKEMVKVGSNGPPSSNLFNLQKPNPCRVKWLLFTVFLYNNHLCTMAMF